MASVTKDNEQNKSQSADDAEEVEQDDVRALDSARRTDPKPAAGFFTIYKKGQGYWTRMGTLLGVTILGLMFAYTLYHQVPAGFFAKNMETGNRVGAGIAIGFLLVYGYFAIRLMNKPSNVDFLIATDSEMKKVNWTSRKELIGSSKVVIIFMFLIAAYLFLNDILWGYFFYWISVLKTPPLG